jgi:hypothetical protein
LIIHRSVVYGRTDPDIQKLDAYLVRSMQPTRVVVEIHRWWLAAWVALHDDLAKSDSVDPVERVSSRLACFVALSGPMDLTRERPTELARQPLRGQPTSPV